jgi:hypothetical protein
MRLTRLTVCLFSLLWAAVAQTPRARDGKPDLSGVWAPDGKFAGDFSKALIAGEKISMLPAAEKTMKERKKKDDPVNRCLPMGVPRLSAFPEKIVQTSTEVIILDEGDIHTFRLIYLAGRPHPKEPEPTWYGDSIGKWDGDTLVVDTIGFNGRTRLDTIGHPHSADMHVIERFQRTDLGHIAYEITIDDPKIYTKPWKNVRTFTLRPDWEIMEYSCEENNKDFFEGHIKSTQDPNKPSPAK